MSDASTFLATGRRKRASARVRITTGSGNLKINGRDLADYFTIEQDQRAVVAPLKATENESSFDITARVQGGGTTGQAGAVSLGIARALQKFDSELRAPLKKDGHLSRDPREKERKKAGQPGARKKFQFSKR
ncbi:MAG: 30S ribosomal protein S9 [Verrucomicrobiota bacterium]